MSSRHQAGAEQIVASPVLPLRRRADHRSECVSELLMGSRLHVLARRDDERWLRVLAPDGYRAWVRSWGTCEVDVRWPARGLFVSAVATSLRQRPERGARPAGVVSIGCRLELRERRRGWRRVATPDGRAGWIAAAAVEADTLAAAGGFWDPPAAGGPRPAGEAFARAALPRILARAGSLLGIAYRWGGASGMGLDCSGLIRLVLGLEGVSLPRDAYAQAAVLETWRARIDPSRLRAGDLVFFGDSTSRIDHVGLGIGGRRGRFLHASGRVRLSGLDPGEAHYERRLAARVQCVIRPPWGRSRASFRGA